MTDAALGPVLGFAPDQLSGFRIGVTSDRRSDDLIDAFERRGAQVMHAPTLRMANLQHDEPVIATTRAIVARPPAVLLATTSYGMRRWLEVADAAGIGLELVDALERADILVRGPKARGAIRAAGLDDGGMAAQETTASLVDFVLDRYPKPTTMVLQLHGYPDRLQLERLTAAGHEVTTVAPYRWVDPESGDERVPKLIDAICGHRLDCVTFTSAPAVEALFATSEALGRLGDLLDAFADGVVTATVGPVTSAPLRAVGIEPIQPDRYRMGALIRLVCEELPSRAVRRVRTVHGDVEMRGSVVTVAGDEVRLSPSSLALFRTLVCAGGAVVTRRELARAMPTDADDHAMEVALGRLRRSLGVPGLVATVVKRGYRIDV